MKPLPTPRSRSSLHSDSLPHDTALAVLRKRLLQTLAVLAMFAAFAGCGMNLANKRNEQYGVSVHALNYSSREVAYIAVEQPGHPEGGAGGDALNPYGGGGDICCFSVPAKWSPDFRVVVAYQFYPETEYRRVEVGVPPYPNGKAGDIWLIVHPDFTVEAVVSDFGPSRPEWPGSIKGYPVPSREYRLKKWKELVEETQADVASSKQSLDEFSEDDVKETWKFRKGLRDKDLDKFSGPDDPAFTKYLVEEYKKELQFFSLRLQYLLNHKP